MSDATPPPAEPTPPVDQPQPARRSRHLWFPITLVAVEVMALAALHYLETSERLPPAESFLMKFSTLGLSTILLFAWFVVFAPVPGWIRAYVGVLSVAIVAVLLAMVRVEGVSGDIWPRLRFRWLPHPDQMLPTADAVGNTAATADLASTTPDDSPQFLGPGRLATWPAMHLAHDWSAEPPRELWRKPIGAGWGSFAVVGHYGVTQEQRGGEELITCYDVDNGNLLWSHAIPVRFEETLAGIGPRATPTVHEGKVYTVGAVGHLTCLDGATGEVLWQRDLVEENNAVPPQWGKSCSPLVYGKLVIASAGGSGGRSLVAYDKDSGDTVWSAGDDASSYSSPAVMTLGDTEQIVMVGATTVTAHDPADGHILWQHPWPEEGRASPNVSQPLAVGGDRILMTKGYGVGAALWHITRDGDDWKVDVLWRNRNLKTKFTNVVVRDGHAYALDEGILSCVEIDSGKRLWKRGRYNHGQVLLVGDLLLVQSERGELALVEATPDGYHELARMQAIAGQSWNYPTLAGNRLLVRSDVEAACYELPLAE